MASGDLSPDQTRYVDIVASATGLARLVVVAWVGSESGWGANKAGHNYLNIGPGRTYSSVEVAAANAAGLVNASDYYKGIRAAIPAGPGAQIQAIGASPWGTSATLLNSVYADLSGTPAVQNVSAVQNVNIVSDAAGAVAGAAGNALGALGGLVSGAVGDVAGAAAEGATSGMKAVVDALAPVLVGAGLTIVFTVAAFALIALGVNHLFGNSAQDIFEQVSGVVGTAAGAAKLAAI